MRGGHGRGFAEAGLVEQVEARDLRLVLELGRELALRLGECGLHAVGVEGEVLERPVARRRDVTAGEL